MTTDEAKMTLQSWRIDGANEPTKKVREALALIEKDAELAAWWQKEQEFNSRMEESVGRIDVPPGLRQSILNERTESKADRKKVVYFPRFIPVAASFIALLFVGILLFDPLPAEAEPELDEFVGHVSSYDIDPEEMILTPDPEIALFELQKRLGTAPAQLPDRLHSLEPTAIHSTQWREVLIGVILMKDSQGNVHSLYLVESSEFPDQRDHPAHPEVRKIQDKALLVWTEQPYLYALSGPRAVEFLNR